MQAEVENRIENFNLNNYLIRNINKRLADVKIHEFKKLNELALTIKMISVIFGFSIGLFGNLIYSKYLLINKKFKDKKSMV